MEKLGVVLFFGLIVLSGFVSAQDIFDSNSEMNITSPGLVFYNYSKIQLKIEINEKCDLGYTDYVLGIQDFYYNFYNESENFILLDGKKYKLLCRDCDNYDKIKRFKEGIHILNFKCLDKPEINTSSLFFVDTKIPRISEAFPEQDSFMNGLFVVGYTEENPIVIGVNLSSYYLTKTGFPIPDIPLDEVCPFGRNKMCFFETDLSEYDGEEIEYSFFIWDFGLNQVETKKIKVKVDTTLPVINFINYSINKNAVNFNISVDEKNFDFGGYFDYKYKNLKFKKICSELDNGSCNSKKAFSKGNHTLGFFVFDKAGNYANQNVSFVI